MPADLADRLARRTLELVDIPSQSRSEAAALAYCVGVLRDAGVAVREAGDSCVLAGALAAGRTDRPLVVLAGHVDTVPAQGNLPGAIADGAVHGLGTADMKGAVAVMLELVASPATSAVDVGVCLFGREELPFGDSALTPLLAREAVLRDVDLAVVMEPTSNALHAGCLGNLNATWTFSGRAGHSARPWLADNAIHRAGPAIAAVGALEPVDVVSDGLVFREVVSVTTVSGGVARNVVPDMCVAEVNMRYAPGTSPSEAEARLRALLEPFGEVRIDGNAPSAPAALSSPLAQRLAAGLAVEPKQAWTPVAEFAAAGVPAVNVGPGDPAQAHKRSEHVRIEALVECHRLLEAFLCA